MQKIDINVKTLINESCFTLTGRYFFVLTSHVRAPVYSFCVITIWCESLMWLTTAHRHPWGSVFICYVHLNCHSPFGSCSFSEQYGTHSYLLDSVWSDTSYPPYICTYWKVNHLPSHWCFPNLSTGFVLSNSILCQVCSLMWVCSVNFSRPHNLPSSANGSCYRTTSGWPAWADQTANCIEGRKREDNDWQEERGKRWEKEELIQEIKLWTGRRRLSFQVYTFAVLYKSGLTRVTSNQSTPPASDYLGRVTWSAGASDTSANRWRCLQSALAIKQWTDVQVRKYNEVNFFCNS